MTTIRLRAWAAPLLPLLAPACHEAPRSSAMPVTEASSAAASDMARIDADVRLDVALKRIAILEREVAELKADPATVEADLLRQQLSVTQNALADANRDTARDDPALSRPDGSAASTSPPPRDGRLTQPSPAASRTGVKPADRPKLRAADHPGLDPDPR